MIKGTLLLINTCINIIQPVSFCWIIPYILKQSSNFQKEFSMTMEFISGGRSNLIYATKKLRKLCLGAMTKERNILRLLNFTIV